MAGSSHGLARRAKRRSKSLIRIGAGVVGVVTAVLVLWLVSAQPSAKSVGFSAAGRASSERLE